MLSLEYMARTSVPDFIVLSLLSYFLWYAMAIRKDDIVKGNQSYLQCLEFVSGGWVNTSVAEFEEPLFDTILNCSQLPAILTAHLFKTQVVLSFQVAVINTFCIQYSVHSL